VIPKPTVKVWMREEKYAFILHFFRCPRRHRFFVYKDIPFREFYEVISFFILKGELWK